MLQINNTVKEATELIKPFMQKKVRYGRIRTITVVAYSVIVLILIIITATVTY